MERMDTHEIVKELIATGFTTEQAEAVTKAINKRFSNITTKHDIKDIRPLEVKRDSKIDKTKFLFGVVISLFITINLAMGGLGYIIYYKIKPTINQDKNTLR